MSQIFISYAREDLENAREIYRLLTENHFSAWMDERELLPGQDWKLAIEKSINTCNIFIACISSKSVLKQGYIQKELRMAYEVLDTIPDGRVFIIPVRLDDCEIPSRLEHIQRLDFFKPGSKKKLIKAITLQLNSSVTNQQPGKHAYVEKLPTSAEKASKSPIEFRKALKKAITNMSINQDKSKELVKHELGVALGRNGVSAIEYWEKGHVPSIEDVEKLVQTLIEQKGITEKTHLLKFLASSGYEEFGKLFDELSPELIQEEALSFIDTTRQDWGEAPDSGNFFGRKREILEIERWISLGNCRIVALLGIGGIGKTILAAKVARRMSSQYDYLIWRSVRESPPIKTIIEEFVRFLSHEELSMLPNDLETQILNLLGYLRKHRCLLVLDNLESIMQGGSHAGSYREGYEGYGRFIQLVGETEHKSCLLLTSREKPKELTLWDDNAYTIRSCNVLGMELADLKAMLKDSSVEGSEKDWLETSQIYGGNPLALKVMAGTIRNLFDGKLERFLAEGGVIFGDIRNTLNEQFERLTMFEQNIMYWLSVEREPVPLETLHQDLHIFVPMGNLFDALDSLKHRSLIEKTSSGFTLQNVVMEYVTNRLIAKCVDEINDQTIAILSNISLAKATARDYVRETQLRLIVKPVVDILLATHAIGDVEDLLKQRLVQLQKSHRQKPGYDAGNIITLLTHLEINLDGYDFSDLAIWEANFQNVNLENSNFSRSRFDRCNFTQIFGNLLSIAFSPSGEYVAAGAKTGEILMWELKTHRLVVKFRGHTDWVRTLCFSENGSELFSAADDQTIRMWDTKTGYPIKTFNGHRGRVMALAIDFERQLLFSGGEDPFIKLWDISTGICIKEFKGHIKWIFSLKLSPDKQLLLSASSDSTLKLWERDAYTCIKTLHGHRSYVWTAAFSRDGSLIASGSHDGTIRIWRGKDGSPIRTINIPDMQIRSLAFSPQGDRLAAVASNASFVKVWDVKTGQLLKTLIGHENIVWAVEFSPKGDLLASGGDDHSLRMWSVQDFGSIFSYKGYSAGILSIAFSPIDPTMLVGAYEDGVARLWNIKTGQSWRFFKKADQPVTKVTFNPTATIIACTSQNGLVHLVNAQTGRVLQSFRGGNTSFITAAFSPDGQMLFTGGSGSPTSIWDVKTNFLIASLSAPVENYFFIFDIQKQWLIAGCENGLIQCWDVKEIKDGKLFHTIEAHQSAIWSLSFNEKTQQLASASSDHTVQLWDMMNIERTAVLNGHTDQVKSVSFSPDGQLIASGGYDKTIRIWNPQSFDCLHVLQGHTDAVWSVAFNSNGQVLASGSRDGTIRIWDTTTFECIKVLRPSRPYEKMNITKATGLNESQKENLFLLGAIEDDVLGI